MELLQATYETIKMSLIALFFSYLLGLPLGVLTNESDKYGLFKNKIIHSVCEVIIGFGRAVPFTILMVLTLPLTRFIVGTGIGSAACCIPLTIAATPFVGRQISQSLDQVDMWVIKAAKIDNASKLKIIVKIKIGSRLFDIVSSIGNTSIAIISYTAICGMLGGGGLGDYAITKGYYQYDWLSVAIATIIIVVIVCVFQWLFKFISRLIDWRK